MALFIVFSKATGQEVLRYESAQAEEWSGFEFANFEHVEQPEVPVEVTPIDDSLEWRIVVGSFFDRFGGYKYPILASSEPLIQAIIKDCSVRKYIDLKGRRADLIQAIMLIQSKGYPIDATVILDVKPNTEEVFNG